MTWNQGNKTIIENVKSITVYMKDYSDTSLDKDWIPHTFSEPVQVEMVLHDGILVTAKVGEGAEGGTTSPDGGENA